MGGELAQSVDGLLAKYLDYVCELGKIQHSVAYEILGGHEVMLLQTSAELRETIPMETSSFWASLICSFGLGADVVPHNYIAQSTPRLEAF